MVPHGTDPISIVLPVSTPQESHTCVVAFPEESLTSLLVSWNEEDLSVERRRGMLFLKLLRPASGDLHALGSSGTLYRLHVRPAESGEPCDARITVLAPPAPEFRPVASLELMRAMRLGRRLPDATIRSTRISLYRSEEFDLESRAAYETPGLQGFVLLLTNRSREKARVDPSRFSAEGLLLIGARTMTLSPGESTSLYLVFAR